VVGRVGRVVGSWVPRSAVRAVGLGRVVVGPVGLRWVAVGQWSFGEGCWQRWGDGVDRDEVVAAEGADPEVAVGVVAV
jgi:hypothetical protein